MPGSEKEVKVKTLDFDGFPLTSCTESEWLSARHAYKADQLNVKKSKNRVTAFAANTPEENGNLSSKSEKSVKSTSSNTSSYTSATFTSQEQRSTIPSSVKQKELEDAVIRCTTITSERNIDSGPSTPTMLQVAEDLSSPMAQSKLSKKLSEVALANDCRPKANDSTRSVRACKSLAYLQLAFNATSDGSHLTSTSKSCTFQGSSSKMPDELNGEEPIEIQTTNTEDQVIEFGQDNVLMGAFNFIDLVVEVIDKFENRLSIKSVESKVYEQNPIKKKRVYYANYPTDCDNDHRGGIIYGAHPTHYRQSSN